MEKQFEMNSIKLRYILQHYYDMGKNAAQAYEKICAVYGNGTLSRSAVRKWFARFRSGDFDVRDKPRSGRPFKVEADEVLKRIRQNKYLTSTAIGADLGVDHKTVLAHLHRAGYKKKLNAWVCPKSNLKNKAKKDSVKKGKKKVGSKRVQYVRIQMRNKHKG